MAPGARQQLIPNANSPHLLTRLLEMVSRGVRTTRGLQEALGIDVRTVQYYTQAAEWLGMVEGEGEAALTPLGLEYVYADRDRAAVYARAVWGTTFVQDLMEGRDGLPDRDSIGALVAASDPDLAPATVRRRASAIRNLIAPAVSRGPLTPSATQLDLPITPAAPEARAPQLGLEAGRDYNPDVYRFLLASLVDHGELTLGEVRALLDLAGAREAPIGGYADLALARGDATRREDGLVVTQGAVVNRDLCETTPSVILSDPGYRAWLADLLAGDRPAEIRRDQQAAKYRHWDVRLFGAPASSDHLRGQLDHVLMDRSLASYPVRGGAGASPVSAPGPFLDVWTTTGLLIALPPPLVRVTGGVALVNQVLRQARQGAGHVGPPDLAHRPAIAHGGLLHPGESLPRSVPDTRSLRLRLLSHAPYPALATALLLLHRLDAGDVEVAELSGQWMVQVRGGPVGALLTVLDGFATSRGWLASRRDAGGLDAAALLSVLDGLGVALLVGGRAVLAESFFTQLRREAEEGEVHNKLAPLAEALADHLDSLPVQESRR